MEIFPTIKGRSGYVNRISLYRKGQVGGRGPSKEIPMNRRTALSTQVILGPWRAEMTDSPQFLPCICCPSVIPKGKLSLGLLLFMTDGTPQPIYPEFAGTASISRLDWPQLCTMVGTRGSKMIKSIWLGIQIHTLPSIHFFNKYLRSTNYMIGAGATVMKMTGMRNFQKLLYLGMVENTCWLHKQINKIHTSTMHLIYHRFSLNSMISSEYIQNFSREVNRNLHAYGY